MSIGGIAFTCGARSSSSGSSGWRSTRPDLIPRYEKLYARGRACAAGRAGPAVGAREDRPAARAGAAGLRRGRRPSPSLNRSPSRPRCSERDYARARMRVWADLTNTAHVSSSGRSSSRSSGRATRWRSRPGPCRTPSSSWTTGATPTRSSASTAGQPGSARCGRRPRGSRGLVRLDGAEASATGSGTPRSTWPPSCRLLGILNSTMFDYEWATTQHHVICRLANRVLVPDADPGRAPEALWSEAVAYSEAGLKTTWPRLGAGPRCLLSSQPGARASAVRDPHGTVLRASTWVGLENRCSLR